MIAKKDMNVRPLLSIVIANYNYGRFLEEAIQSIIAQDMGNRIELIICDAASTDNSVDIIKKYANGLPPNTSYKEWMSQSDSQLTTHNSQLITWWCSEKDGGQSAAFNKGFSHAQGRFLTWLNADDVILPGALKKFECAVAKYPECEWFVGGCFWLDPEMKIFKCGRARRMSRFRARHGIVNVCGPSSFFSKELLQKVGGVDERFKYTMDTDLWLRFALLANVSFRPFAKYAWGLRLHPDAKMSGHKFTSNGRILEGAESSEAFRKNTSRLNQLQLERNWIKEKLHLVMQTMPSNMVQRLLSSDLLPAVMSRVDSWLFTGKFYLEIYK